MIEVKVHALVRPTERVEKVVRAVDRVFPGLTLDIRADRIQGYGGPASLQVFHRLLREERILDTARSVMLEGRIGESFQFRISKVGALMGRLAFPPDEEPLGSVHVEISGDVRLVDWLAPKTEDGRPVLEIALEDLEDHVGIQDRTGSVRSSEVDMDGLSDGDFLPCPKGAGLPASQNTFGSSTGMNSTQSVPTALPPKFQVRLYEVHGTSG